jgi:hypothetical protein
MGLLLLKLASEGCGVLTVGEALVQATSPIEQRIIRMEELPVLV